MLFFIFGRCPKNCSIARKNYFARLWGAAAPHPPSSYAYDCGRVATEESGVSKSSRHGIGAIAHAAL